MPLSILSKGEASPLSSQANEPPPPPPPPKRLASLTFFLSNVPPAESSIKTMSSSTGVAFSVKLLKSAADLLSWRQLFLSKVSKSYPWLR